MTYRDDREALHERVAKLEQELDDARREGQQQGRDEAQARAAALEDRVRDMRAELERMEGELEAMRGKAPARRGSNSMVLAAAVIIAIALVAILTSLLVARRAPQPPRVVDSPPPLATPATAPTPIPPPTVAAAPAPPSRRTTTARWTAKVTHAEGLALAAGAACTIDATIATSDATNAVVPELAIVCGAQKLYRSSDSFSGMSQSSNDAREVLGASDDKGTFTLMYRDIGTRTGERAQVDLDTMARQGEVFRDTIPRFRVALSIARESTPGAPLAGADQRMRRTGKVVEARGAPGVKAGASCVLRAMPIGKKKECVAEVTCAGAVLWPQSAPVQCTYDGAQPSDVSADGDAQLAIAGSTLTLKNKTVDATIELE